MLEVTSTVDLREAVDFTNRILLQNATLIGEQNLLHAVATAKGTVGIELISNPGVIVKDLGVPENAVQAARFAHDRATEKALAGR